MQGSSFEWQESYPGLSLKACVLGEHLSNAPSVRPPDVHMCTCSDALYIVKGLDSQRTMTKVVFFSSLMTLFFLLCLLNMTFLFLVYFQSPEGKCKFFTPTTLAIITDG